MEKEEVRHLLPKLGDKRKEYPTRLTEHGPHPGPQPCTVVGVHPGHLWYMVEFECGTRECYKVPARRNCGGKEAEA